MSSLYFRRRHHSLPLQHSSSLPPLLFFRPCPFALAGPIIANHAYGAPFDNLTTVTAAMLESCDASELTIQRLAACRNSQKSCQCHSVNQHALAAFLIGAYRGVTADEYVLRHGGVVMRLALSWLAGVAVG